MFVHLIASGASNPMEMDLNRDPLKGGHSQRLEWPRKDIPKQKGSKT